MKMTDKKSSESRRKLLKSIAAGSAVIVAGKSLPENWTKPVVDSVMLPAHAQTSIICTIDITYAISVPGGDVDGSYSYNIYNYPGGWNEVPPVSVNFSTSVNLTIPIALAPGQYEVSAGASAQQTIDGNDTTATGQTSLSCCSAPIPLGQNWTIDNSNTSSGGGDNVLVTIGADGSCQVAPAPSAPSDIRLKTNIEALSISREGYNLYKFQYIGENNGNTYVGVMAQDVISRNPEAVIQNASGFYMVRYAQLGLKMVTLKQWKSEGPDSVELLH